MLYTRECLCGARVYITGTQGTFLAYGVTCVIVFVGYFSLIFFYVSKQTVPPPIEDSGAGQTESVYLAPHGVPGGIPRSPSKAKGSLRRTIPVSRLTYLPTYIDVLARLILRQF